MTKTEYEKIIEALKYTFNDKLFSASDVVNDNSLRLHIESIFHGTIKADSPRSVGKILSGTIGKYNCRSILVKKKFQNSFRFKVVDNENQWPILDEIKQSEDIEALADLIASKIYEKLDLRLEDIELTLGLRGEKVSISNSFNFTESELKKLTSSGEYRDTKLKGFSLRISGNTKTFQIRKKVNGKDKRLKVGEYPIMSLAQARAKALDLIRKLEAQA